MRQERRQGEGLVSRKKKDEEGLAELNDHRTSMQTRYVPGALSHPPGSWTEAFSQAKPLQSVQSVPPLARAVRGRYAQLMK